MSACHDTIYTFAIGIGVGMMLAAFCLALLVYRTFKTTDYQEPKS